MKKIFHLLSVLVVMTLTSSCLTSGLKEIETYEGNEIVSIRTVAHRYYTTEKIPASDEVKVKQSDLKINGAQRDEKNGTIAVEITIPTNFPKDQIDKVKMSNLVVIVNISTAATIEPLDVAPKLGVPGDWSKSNKYLVRAANGKTKEWTISLTLKK